MHPVFLAPIIIALGLEGAPADAIVTTVGEPFPVIAMPSIDGSTPFSIQKFRGKKVILHIFASW